MGDNIKKNCYTNCHETPNFIKVSPGVKLGFAVTCESSAYFSSSQVKVAVKSGSFAFVSILYLFVLKAVFTGFLWRRITVWSVQNWIFVSFWRPSCRITDLSVQFMRRGRGENHQGDDNDNASDDFSGGQCFFLSSAILGMWG